MLIYFDETYDGGHAYLVLGALFNPHSRYLHERLREIKRAHNFRDTRTGRYKEIKYNDCYTQENYNVCHDAIDAFMDSTSWYRAIVIKQSELDLNRFGTPHETDTLKKARAYKKFAEMLICKNTVNVVNGVLLTDELTRCNGDEFIDRMKEIFCVPGNPYYAGRNDAPLKDVLDVQSSSEQYQVIQVCDLLSGCIINDHFPTANRWKNEIRQYVVRSLGVDSLKESYWGQYKRADLDDSHPKFNIWYWHPTGSP